MNINTQFKTFALLCALPLSNTFAAQHAAAEPLQAKLAAIDAMSDHEMLCKVFPYSLDFVQQELAHAKQRLQEDNSPAAMVLAKIQAKTHRSARTYWAISNELTSCNDHARKQFLQSQLDNHNAQFTANVKEAQKAANALVVNQPVAAYNYAVSRMSVFHRHAALLLAQKEKLEKEKAQWQQEKHALITRLKGYELLEDGQQIEGMPNVPGGPKMVHKRRGSF